MRTNIELQHCTMKTTLQETLAQSDKPGTSSTYSACVVRKYSAAFRKQFKHRQSLLVPVLQHVSEQLCKQPDLKDALQKAYTKVLGPSYDPQLLNNISKLRCIRKSKNSMHKIPGIVRDIKKKYRSYRRTSEMCGVSKSELHRLCTTGNHSAAKENYVRKLTSHLKEQVAQYYRSCGTSMELPDKKYVGKRFMLHNIAVAHQSFQRETGVKIGFSTFAKLRPRDVHLSAQTPHRQCLCDKCANISSLQGTLRGYRVKGIPTTVDECLASTLCEKEIIQYGKLSTYRRICCERQCAECGVHQLALQVKKCNTREFMMKQVKWHMWKAEVKASGDKQTSKLINKESSGTLLDLMNIFLNELRVHSQHVFLAKWQTNDFKQLKEDLMPGELLIVYDFSRNYLCSYQDEPQGGYFMKEQATIFPAVCYYKCPQDDCSKTVSEELIHISKDLKHDTTLATILQKKSVDYLQSKGVAVDHIYEFTDRCPTHFSNRNVFNGISKKTIPLVRSFFCPGHGKSVSDGSGSRVKRAAWVGVITKKAVVRNAEGLYTYCKETLESKNASEKGCQHYSVSVHYTGKVQRGKKPSALTLDRTRDISQLRNTGVPGVVQIRHVSCSCRSCRLGIAGCTNESYVKPWQTFPCDSKAEKADYSAVGNKLWDEFSMLKYSDPVPKPDSTWVHYVREEDFMVSNEICDGGPISTSEKDSAEEATSELCIARKPSKLLSKPRHATVDHFDWNAVLQAIIKPNTYAGLQEVVHSFTLPDLDTSDIVTTSSWKRRDAVDTVAEGVKPYFIRGRTARVTGADGNCYCRCLSRLQYASENRHLEMRVRLVFEGVTHSKLYLSEQHLLKGMNPAGNFRNVTERVASYCEPYIAGDAERTFQEEMMLIRKPGQYTSLWEFFIAASVLQRTIVSAYPLHFAHFLLVDFNRSMLPRQERVGKSSNNEDVYIMWTPMYDPGNTPNHFVPLLPEM